MHAHESSYQEQTQLVSKVLLERISYFVSTMADQHGYPPVTGTSRREMVGDRKAAYSDISKLPQITENAFKSIQMRNSPQSNSGESNTSMTMDYTS